jgi:hypothetical protein
MVRSATMRQPLWTGGARLALLAAVVAVGGCGPIEYISVVTFQARKAISAAKGARADRLAPYEYTAAQEYLHKARELGGYARYQQSVEFGRKARDFGNKAQEVARDRANTGLPQPPGEAQQQQPKDGAK